MFPGAAPCPCLELATLGRQTCEATCRPGLASASFLLRGQREQDYSCTSSLPPRKCFLPSVSGLRLRLRSQCCHWRSTGAEHICSHCASPHSHPHHPHLQSLAKGSKVLPISSATSFFLLLLLPHLWKCAGPRFRREGRAFCRAMAILTLRCLGLKACPGSCPSASLLQAFPVCSERVVPH